MKKHITFLILIISLVLTGCSAPNTFAPTSPAISSNPATNLVPDQQALTGLNRNLAANYGSSFVVQFEGSSRWTYMLNTRTTQALSELSLHIEGIEGPNNPGDIRLVTDGVTSWLIGQGTDQQCIQFPNGQGMDPEWIFPESLLSVPDMNRFIEFANKENLSGCTAQHYAGSTGNIGNWENVKAEVWQDESNQALLRYSLEGQTEDPFFGAGTGRLSARYEAFDLENAVIEPVPGCEIDVPLPDGISNFVRLPGMASFESILRPEVLLTFFQQQLPGLSWVEKEVPAMAEGSTIMSYTRNAEDVEIHIEAGSNGGSLVKLLFLKTQ